MIANLSLCDYTRHIWYNRKVESDLIVRPEAPRRFAGGVQLQKCNATNAAGERCRSWAVDGPPHGAYCRTHAKVLAKQEGGPRREVKPVGVRAKLAQAAAEDYELIRSVLRTTLQAETVRHQKCSYCKRSNEFVSPNDNARIRAVETWLEQGFGRVAQQAEAPTVGGAEEFARVLDQLDSIAFDDWCLGMLLKFLDVAARRDLPPVPDAGKVATRQAQVREAVAKLLGLDEETIERGVTTFERVKRELRDVA
jgi:hypothetical protein